PISHLLFFFNDPATTQIYTLSLHDALPILDVGEGARVAIAESDLEDYPGLWLRGTSGNGLAAVFPPYPLKEKLERDRDLKVVERDRKSTRLNSSHVAISYAVFCLKKKKKET